MHSAYGYAHQKKVGESLEDVNAWLEKSADQLQATYETQTIGQNMALEKTQFIDMKDVKQKQQCLMPLAGILNQHEPNRTPQVKLVDSSQSYCCASNPFNNNTASKFQGARESSSPLRLGGEA